MKLFNLIDATGSVLRCGVTISPLTEAPPGCQWMPYVPDATVNETRRRELLMEQMAIIERRQDRALRELALGDQTAVTRLANIDAQIVALRARL